MKIILFKILTVIALSFVYKHLYTVFTKRKLTIFELVIYVIALIFIVFAKQYAYYYAGLVVIGWFIFFVSKKILKKR